ncbi:MAG: hypothetical protein ACE5DW_04050 [Thermodesulfobacteriota bacterium]
MEKLRCQNCGLDISPEALKYVVEIRSFADFDGYIDEDNSGGIEDDINTFLDAMEDMDITKVYEEVSKDLILILCKKCRDNFMDDPLQTGFQSQQGDNFKPILH